MEKIKVGDTVKLKGVDFTFVVEGFSTVDGQKMVDSLYGSFNIDLVELVEKQGP
ncbi:MAG TPA: hypothetical protein PK122_01450 [Candidatus Paceibacterota bacterium]|nr:hypothetical protein [Candidatus Paceibacterota bacterium]